MKRAVNRIDKNLKPQGQMSLDQAMGRIQCLEREISEALESMQDKVHQLGTLMEFSNLLNSSLDPAAVQEKALQATCKLLRSQTASLLLVDRKTGELYWEAALGPNGEKLKETRLQIDDRSIAGSVAMSGEGVIINDAQGDPRHSKAAGILTGLKTVSMVCAPLHTKGKIVGVLQAINKLSDEAVFNHDDLKLLETLGNQVAIAIENSRLYTDLKQSFYGTVEALAETIEKKDHYTGGHTKRVVHYSMCIAKYLNLTTEELERIELGALLHDIGKIGVEDSILKKDAPLTAQEWKVMQKHPELGHDILSRVSSLEDVIAGMRFHHERWDGKGYPLGLKGLEIPLIARIISVADTYDAMVSTRPYRKGLSPEIAQKEIIQHSGTQFCPEVVEAFKKAFQFEKMGRGSGGSRLSNCD